MLHDWAERRGARETDGAPRGTQRFGMREQVKGESGGRKRIMRHTIWEGRREEDTNSSISQWTKGLREWKSRAALFNLSIPVAPSWLKKDCLLIETSLFFTVWRTKHCHSLFNHIYFISQNDSKSSGQMGFQACFFFLGLLSSHITDTRYQKLWDPRVKDIMLTGHVWIAFPFWHLTSPSESVTVRSNGSTAE